MRRKLFETPLNEWHALDHDGYYYRFVYHDPERVKEYINAGYKRHHSWKDIGRTERHGNKTGTVG